MWPQRGAAFELQPLGSHVAVRDGPSPVCLTHCLAGVDYGHEHHQVRGQNLQLPRRRWISSSCGRFAANGVASLRGLLPRRRWAFLLQWCFEVGFIDSRLCWTCDFASLTDRYSQRRSRWSGGRICVASTAIFFRTHGPIGIRCAPPDVARIERSMRDAAPL